MAFGPAPIGFAAFVLVKFAGYSYGGHLLSQHYEKPRNPFAVGATRTIIGVTTAGIYFCSWRFLHFEPSDIVWFLGLVPVRILEWGLLIRIFYEKTFLRSSRSLTYSVLGTIGSFALDAIGIGAALVVPAECGSANGDQLMRRSIADRSMVIDA